MIEPTHFTTDATDPADDRSMRVMEYTMAIVALVAALLLSLR